jgi:hypothetical protein
MVSIIRAARCMAAAVAVEIVAMSSAGALNIAFDANHLSAAAGSTISFVGEIQNDTAYVLSGPTDLFLNFSSYDPTVVSPNDLLPLSSLSLAPGVTSGPLALIGVDIAPATAPGTYELQVSMQDVFGGDDADASGIYTLLISVIPEPAAYLLMLAGLAGLAGFAGAQRLRGIGRKATIACDSFSEVQP